MAKAKDLQRWRTNLNKYMIGKRTELAKHYWEIGKNSKDIRRYIGFMTIIFSFPLIYLMDYIDAKTNNRLNNVLQAAYKRSLQRQNNRV